MATLKAAAAGQFAKRRSVQMNHLAAEVTGCLASEEGAIVVCGCLVESLQPGESLSDELGESQQWQEEYARTNGVGEKPHEERSRRATADCQSQDEKLMCSARTI
jgi:hypothetical protein